MRPPLVLFLCLAACGGSEKVAWDAAPADAPAIADARPPDAEPPVDATPRPDARPGDLSCADLPDGGAAPAMITLSGRILQGLLSLQNSANVNIEVLPPSETGTPIVTAKTAADGRFSLAIPTGGVPIEIVGRFNKAGYIQEWFYPGLPIARSYSGLQGLMGTVTDLDNPLIGLVFGTSWDQKKGLVAVLVLDCKNVPIEGARIALDPPPDKLVYADSDFLPAPVFTETSRSGAVYGWNAPVGTITVTGSVGGRPLKGHTFKTHAGEISLTLLTP